MAGPNLFVQIVTRGHADAGSEPKIKAVQNVYTFRRPTGAGTPTKTAIATAFKTAILTPLQPCLSVSYITDWLDVRFLDDPFDPFYTSALALDGTVTGDSLPSVNNVTLQLKSGLRGRSNRGSKHYGPIGESDTQLDGLTSGALTRWATFVAALLAGFTDGGGFVWTPFIVSQLGSTFSPTVATVVGVNVTEILVNPTLGIMRRRKE
jgi:hypothetical protein